MRIMRKQNSERYLCKTRNVLGCCLFLLCVHAGMMIVFTWKGIFGGRKGAGMVNFSGKKDIPYFSSVFSSFLLVTQTQSLLSCLFKLIAWLYVRWKVLFFTLHKKRY
ncbi:hypothetical protein QBC38DRAFT_482219 [Podospora fimiseda]|uniref:Uncharacterized protein n=1 Tax=Podospora fimiseda TaxID=252190 RepID=A0AAN7BM08_9PEZI|nr:hypothetical protein QBC38DRAFT_482219 [Podospora fimiseda]